MIKRQTVTSQIVDYVLALIKSGKVKRGEQLPTEKELTKTLRVSRTCVREAMKSLEALNLISIGPRVGAIVLEPSPTTLLGAEQFAAALHVQQTDVLIEFRKVIEVGMASLAAEKATEVDLLALKKAVGDHKHALQTNQLAYQADVDFHLALAAATKNPIVTSVLEMISGPLTEQRRRTNRVPHAAEAGLQDHSRILRAVEEHSAKKAHDAMRSHMETAERYWRIANVQDRTPETSSPTPQPISEES